MGKNILLESERLRLRKLKICDAQEIFETWTNDDEVSKYMRWSTHKSVEDTKQWLLEEEKNYHNNNHYTWGIELKEENKLIGSMGVYYREENDRYEIGYGIAKKYWNKGYTTEAAKCMMEYLINNLNIKKFEASHAKQNIASGKVIKKLGFTYIKNKQCEKFDKTVTFDCKQYYLDIEDKIILVKPTKEHEKQLLEYKEEHLKNGEKVIHACSRLDKMDNYDQWLELLERNSKEETRDENWTVCTNFLGIRERDNKIVGMVSIRHELTTDFLRNYAGHIGYGVRPTERRKGYVTQMFRQALEYCKNELNLKKVMVSCDKHNEGSKKTIINAGGVLTKDYITDEGEDVQIYWIIL